MKRHLDHAPPSSDSDKNEVLLSCSDFACHRVFHTTNDKDKSPGDEDGAGGASDTDCHLASLMSFCACSAPTLVTGAISLSSLTTTSVLLGSSGHYLSLE